VREKFSTYTSGEPEDQIRAPFEQLLREVGADLGIQDIVPIGETLLANSLGRPDYSVTRGKVSCGYVELKAPGKGANTSLLTGHDKQQWARFSNLPNILYSDGREFSLYRTGKQIHSVALPQDPRSFGAQAVSDESSRKLAVLLRDFFEWEPIVPSSAKQLAEYLAPLCRNLRDDVLDSLKNHIPAVESAAKDWRRYLFPGADDARFADAYAQSVTFSLLLARSDGSDTLLIDDAVSTLTHANSLLARALKVLTDPLVKEHLGSTLDVLMRVINKVPAGTMSGGRRDPWLNFYEDFLAEYDPKLRRDAGAYYTPVEVVKAQVCIVDELLRKKFSKKFGFATGGVNVLDPAVGTGTYLLGVIEHALETVQQIEGPGAVPARADVLGNSLYGFELMVGPYAVAALRLTRMLQQYGGHLPGDGAQIMLNNTLESPHEKIPELPLLYQPIGLEHKRAKRVKETVPVLVCLGNPPYDRHEAATQENRAMTGGWVRWGESKNGGDAILKDFITPVIDASKGGDLKNLYNLYVYFWRWALWKTFEHDLALGPGIISFITASSFIDGAAFLGMRKHMRSLCDEIWVIDLGGEGRGTRQDDNVFAIQTPVAITIAVRYGKPQPDKPATVHYTRIEGTRAAKLHQLEILQSLADLKFEDAPDAWSAAFRPAGKSNYFNWPLLTDLMPWQHSGVQLKRTWPIGPTAEVLHERWRLLLTSPDQASAFRETPYRKVSKAVDALNSSAQLEPLNKLPADAKPEAIMRYGYRSYDRQFLIADGRIGDRLRPALWHVNSARQIYFASQFTTPIGEGPALTVSAEVPDLHFFAGRGAKDIVPLYRDVEASQANLHPKLLSTLATAYQRSVDPEDFAAYIYGLLAQSAFTTLFAKDLDNCEIRLPLTADAALFEMVASVGRRLLFLHTYGERFQNGQSWPQSVTKSIKSVSSTDLPKSFRYDKVTRIIHIEDGQFGPVDKAVWEYEVSGLKVVQSWLGYRLASRKGKKSSPLDNITPAGWTSDFTSEFLQLLNLLACTVALHPRQAELLAAVISGPLLKTNDLGSVPDELRNAPKIASIDAAQSTLDL
jgi:hypothetical protein